MEFVFCHKELDLVTNQVTLNQTPRLTRHAIALMSFCWWAWVVELEMCSLFVDDKRIHFL